MNITKICNGCKEDKLLSDFNKDSDKKDGLQTRCKICKRKADLEWRNKNRDYVNEKTRLWRENNKDRSKTSIAKWHKEHPERIRELRNKSWKRRSKEQKLRKNISNAIKRSLRDVFPSKTIFAKLGYSVEDLRNHLSSKFKEGMTWDNHGEWHIDHIIPQSLLPFNSIEDENFIKCWCLENLQPLWARENLLKGNKIIES